jgi:hypothetical protein
LIFIPIESVRVNPKKLRKLSLAKIGNYAVCFEAGDDFPPISVNDCGGFYTIRDGRHRYLAQLHSGYRFIAVVVL